MPSKSEYRNIGLLFCAQAMFMTSQIVLFTLGGLVGYMLADDKSLATLPVSIAIIATALTTIPASLLMKRIGRRSGFMIGVLIGIFGLFIAIYAQWTENFWLFVVSAFIMGVTGGFSQYYRFAAAEVVSPAFRSRAISWVISGGIAGAVLGPTLVRHTNDLMSTPFMGSYVSVFGVSLIGMLFLSLLSIPDPTSEEIHETGRPLGQITRLPAFVTAALAGTIGYASMSLVMTATPLAMHGYGFDISDSAFVIQWHAMAMFVPSLFTGHLIHRFGVLKIILIGLVLMFVCVGLAISGIDIMTFSAALIALGLGWNFTFVGASALLTVTYRPAERAKVQATNDFLVFGTVGLASLSSGALLHAYDWNTVNLSALPFLAVTMGVVVWYALHRRREEGLRQQQT